VVNKLNNYLSNTLSFDGIGSQIMIRDYAELFQLINKLNIISTPDSIPNFIDLAVKKDYKGLLNYVFDNKSNFTLFDKIFLFNLDDSNDDNVIQDKPKLNVLNSCLFVANDLNSLVKSISDQGYLVNPGSQK
jgi:hypothetical protein